MSELSHVYFAGVTSPSPVVALLGAIQFEPVNGTSRNLDFGSAPVEEHSHPTDPFLIWLLERAGLQARSYRSDALQRRLPACLRTLRAPSTEHARSRLERRPELLPQAMTSVLIGVSEFFRDPPVFEEMERTLLPRLLEGRSGVRVLSTGCSTGQELYSMAMLLDKRAALDGSDLLGLDCRSEAIQAAVTGSFAVKELEKVPPPLRRHYFKESGQQAVILLSIRNKLRWRMADILTRLGEGLWDVILFRNVAIYLNQERALPLWRRLSERLGPGGILVTGRAERPPRELSLRRISACLYEKSSS